MISLKNNDNNNDTNDNNSNDIDNSKNNDSINSNNNNILFRLPELKLFTRV